MKFLALLVMLLPATVFATLPDTTATNTASNQSVSYYHGTAMKTTADGAQQHALIALMIRKLGSDDRAGVLFTYRIIKGDMDNVYAFIIKRHGADGHPGFYKVFVPVDANITASLDADATINMTDFHESGWGHSHWYQGRHGYAKTSLFLNFVYTTGERVDHNIYIKEYEDGHQKIYSKLSAGSDTDGMQFVWTDKLKKVFTAPGNN